MGYVSTYGTVWKLVRYGRLKLWGLGKALRTEILEKVREAV